LFPNPDGDFPWPNTFLAALSFPNSDWDFPLAQHVPLLEFMFLLIFFVGETDITRQTSWHNKKMAGKPWARHPRAA